MKSQLQYQILFSGHRVTISHPPLTNIKPFLEGVLGHHHYAQKSVCETDLLINFQNNEWHITNGAKIYYQGVRMASAANALINAVVDTLAQKCEQGLLLRAGCIVANNQAFILISPNNCVNAPVLAWALTKGARLISNTIIHYSPASKRISGFITPFTIRQSAIGMLHQAKIQISSLRYTHDNEYCIVPTASFGAVDKRSVDLKKVEASLVVLQTLSKGNIYRNQITLEPAVNQIAMACLNADHDESFKSADCIELCESTKENKKIGFTKLLQLEKIFFNSVITNQVKNICVSNYSV